LGGAAFDAQTICNLLKMIKEFDYTYIVVFVTISGMEKLIDIDYWGSWPRNGIYKSFNQYCKTTFKEGSQTTLLFFIKFKHDKDLYWIIDPEIIQLF